MEGIYEEPYHGSLGMVALTRIRQITSPYAFRRFGIAVRAYGLDAEGTLSHQWRKPAQDVILLPFLRA